MPAVSFLVQPQHLTLPDLPLQSGTTLHAPVVAYEEYGTPTGPVILLGHGGLSGPHMAGLHQPDDLAPGPWDSLIGPGKTLDTNRYRILCPNLLGSMYGSCSPLSTNPATGEPYGPAFPAITFLDQARFTLAFLDALGIERVHLAAGPSMGGCLSLLLAVMAPERIGGVAAVAAAPHLPAEGLAYHNWVLHTITSSPAFNEGHYTPQAMRPTMATVLAMGRLYFAHEEALHLRIDEVVTPGPEAQDARNERAHHYLFNALDAQLEHADPNCYLRLLTAFNTYDLHALGEEYTKIIQRINCPVLLINFKSDSEFPPRHAEALATALNAERYQAATAVAMRSVWGHLGCLTEGNRMAPHFEQLLQRIAG